VLLDGGQELSVNVELRLLALLVHFVLLLLDVKNLALGGLLRLLGLDAIEEGVLQVLRHVHLAQVELGLGGDDVVLIDATQRATVQLERTRDEQQARLELLQEDDTFASMTTSDEDEHGAWRDGAAKRVLVLREVLCVGTELLRLVLGRVEAWESSDADFTRAAVLVALELLLDDASLLGGILALRLLALVGLLPLLDEPEAALVEHATVRQAHDARLLQLGVDWCGARLLLLLWCHFNMLFLYVNERGSPRFQLFVFKL